MTTVLFTLLILASCSINNVNAKKKSPNSVEAVQSNPTQFQDTRKWIDNFKHFRDAVYQANKAEAKKYIDIKSLNGSNGIWELIYSDKEKDFEKLPVNKIKPFTEQDYEKYFDKIFTKRFISCIQKIKTEELFKTGRYQTTEFKEGKATTYLLYATYDKANNSLELNLASNTVRKDGKGEIMDGGEFSIMYIFSLTNNGQIQLTSIGLAG
jgi:hypothetical protein